MEAPDSAIDKCIFCKIVRGELPCHKLFEDDEMLAFRDVNPCAPIHCLIVPKTHFVTLNDVAPTEAALLGRMLLLAPRLVSDEGGNPGADGGFRIMQNNGPDGGQEVMHVHFHVMAGPKPWQQNAKNNRKVAAVKSTVEVKDSEIWVSKGSRWGDIGKGSLAASGAPGKAGIQRWKEAGATAVVTLQREDELTKSETGNVIEQQCSTLGMKWVHLPLNGKSALSAPTTDDIQSLSRIDAVVGLLRDGEKVVVHCSAGMHRTGFVCYMTMRLLGLSADEAKQQLEQMRPVTHAELVKAKEGKNSLQQEAEDMLLSIAARGAART